MVTDTLLILAVDFKGWFDSNLSWADSAVKKTLLFVAALGGIAYLAISRNMQRALKFGAIAAIFLALLFNIEGIAQLIGSLFKSS